MNKKYRRQKVPRRQKNKKLTYKEYSRMCRFKFDVEEFPSEFKLELIDEYGWYSKENPNGISRDHMMSISYGWKRDIPPKILRHPANCKLMRFENNLEKGWRSTLNYLNLLEKINEWNKKYK